MKISIENLDLHIVDPAIYINYKMKGMLTEILHTEDYVLTKTSDISFSMIYVLAYEKEDLILNISEIVPIDVELVTKSYEDISVLYHFKHNL